METTMTLKQDEEEEEEMEVPGPEYFNRRRCQSELTVSNTDQLPIRPLLDETKRFQSYGSRAAYI